MGINTDTDEMRRILERLKKKVTSGIDHEVETNININDLSALIAAYTIELNKNKRNDRKNERSLQVNS
ncbi:hypothetical protein [Veronia pacifica]|uniref:Uncharacterized protein n=1 Tax=Veronia pacifica TaxID=1080227 RepID=A0A1C3EIF0_9GAMM|nr:hypothetical protein [Veronia pacifica]ODA33022.1 hypothetical protein A8L45_12080 [Veronia pacifica]